MPDIKKHKAESELFEKKWFDYGSSTPDEATAVLVAAFSNTLGVYDETKRYFNIAKGLCLADLRSWQKFKWYEKVRVFADEHCLQYNLLLEHAFEARFALGSQTISLKQSHTRRFLKRPWNPSLKTRRQ
jgi:hypothetical protein